MILGANLMAMLVQYLSQKIGIATAKNLPEHCREQFPRPVVWGLWVQGELIAMPPISPSSSARRSPSTCSSGSHSFRPA